MNNQSPPPDPFTRSPLSLLLASFKFPSKWSLEQHLAAVYWYLMAIFVCQAFVFWKVHYAIILMRKVLGTL